MLFLAKLMNQQAKDKIGTKKIKKLNLLQGNIKKVKELGKNENKKFGYIMLIHNCNDDTNRFRKCC